MALVQVARIESQVQQPPASSPLSAARRTSAVPLYPLTNWIGSAVVAANIRGTSSVAPPPMPPIFTGVLAASHRSILVMPLALVKAQARLSVTGAPINST